MRKALLIAIFAPFLLQATAQNYSHRWTNCSMKTDQNEMIYGSCLIYVDRAQNAQTYTLAQPWTNPKINPICSIKLIDANRAIYSTTSRQDTVELDRQTDPNGKIILKIVFDKSSSKPNYIITLNDIEKCGTKKHK